MKVLLSVFAIAILFGSCGSQKEEKQDLNLLAGKSAVVQTDWETAPFDFLDVAFPRIYFLEDVPDVQPSFTGFKEGSGYFSVHYLTPNFPERSFWKYPSEYEALNSPERESLLSGPTRILSDSIAKYLLAHEDQYYVIAGFLPQQFTIPLEGNEFEITPNAKTYFYILEQGAWKFITHLPTKILVDALPDSLYTSLILAHFRQDLKPVAPYFKGDFYVHVETELTTTGMASIGYQFHVSDTTATLETDTYHEPISCNGTYFLKERGSTLELYYADAIVTCIELRPSFQIKQKSNGFFIKGVGGEGTFGEWMLLSKY